MNGGTARLLALLLTFSLAATACGSEPESVIVGASDDNVTADASSTDDPIATTAMSRLLIEGTLWSDAELASLRGTAWVVFEYNGELVDDASLSLWRIEDQGISIGYVDACSSGSALVTGKRQGKWVVHNDDSPQVMCPGQPSSLFHDDNWFEFNYRGGVLTISTDDGQIRAEHWQSTSVHDEPIAVDLDAVPAIAVPEIPLPDLERPDVESLADIDEVVDLPFPECASSGSAGLEPDDRTRERLAWGQALQEPLGELPFIAGYSRGAGLHNREIFVALTVRYGPTLDWLEANVPQGVICLEVPRLGYYDQPDPKVTWTLVDEAGPPDPTATTVQVETPSCKDVTVADIEYLDDQITLTLTAPRTPAGAEVPAMACDQIIDIELSEPIGNRAISAE